MDFSGPFDPKWRLWGQNRVKDGVMLTANELVLTFGGCYLLPLCHFCWKSIKKCHS